MSELPTAPASEPPTRAALSLPRFTAPYDWAAIDATIREDGGAILTGYLPEPERDALNADIDRYLETHGDCGRPESGSAGYDLFLGHKTIRLHGLIEKMPASVPLLARDDLIDWAERMLARVGSSVLLNAAELIQIHPGEPAQMLHRDSDSWPLPVSEDPWILNAIVALDPCTLENGATHVAPGSWRWEKSRQPVPDEVARAVMSPGDAVFFRGDLVHGGGANHSSARRRALSISLCTGWLRAVENSFLNVPIETARRLPARLQALLGYAAHDGTAQLGGMVGLYENGDPARALDAAD